MTKISVESIIMRNRKPFINPGTKHPFVYPDGCIDLSNLGEEVVEELLRESEEALKKGVANYLNNPERYVERCAVLNPQYL
jgi:hypothetical protein